MMFQAAAGWCHARRADVPFAYTMQFWESVTQHDVEGVELTAFANLQKLTGPRRMATWNERGFDHEAIPEGVREAYLSGYFQSWRYHHGMRRDLGALFGLRSAVTVNATAVHVRRGDYVRLAHVHHNLTPEYYARAAEQATGPFVVFSDDPEWAAKHVGPVLGGDWQVHQPGRPFDDIRRMATFREVVTANSSFSWWGAYGGNAERVWAPSRWFADGRQAADVVPPEWTLVDDGA